ncbi:MAG TPA: hypothetical protein DGG95_05975 [Cytophagales bacterium]|jgi:hypothetical protein|nr:hypothetical protein [Cytophagales bacterium]
MRGSRTIFTETLKPFKKEKGKRHFSAKRNTALVYRYFFYTKFTGLRYEIILEKLSDEFFIAPITIIELISDNMVILEEAKSKNMSATDFKTHFPTLDWNLEDTPKKIAHV